MTGYPHAHGGYAPSNQYGPQNNGGYNYGQQQGGYYQPPQPQPQVVYVQNPEQKHSHSAAAGVGTGLCFGLLAGCCCEELCCICC
ncbi:hypothetical protein LPJ61_004856 [Coemansia biformis]|uniref:Cysteine-rich transmembrane CYSTM domain-containing protein n=1 Tax=Coemansia biformis TaxID=1286918 RepID=A0A9W7Y9F6_9FUNG|nr:hypothetical protein LPJ61_004856 [Coemansia biformis]